MNNYKVMFQKVMDYVETEDYGHTSWSAYNCCFQFSSLIFMVTEKLYTEKRKDARKKRVTENNTL